MRSFQKISTEIIHSNPWWQYKHDRYKLSDTEESDYFYGETKGNSMVIPVLEDGRLVLILQYRYLYDKQSVEFPCGGARDDETSLDVARRELKEETGYQAEDLIKLGEFEGANGLCKDKTSLYIGVDLKKVDVPTPEHSESMEILYRRLDEFEDMIKRGEIWDGQTLAAWATASS